MLLHFNTRYNTELTLGSDNIHNLLEAIIDVKQYINKDSYIGLNNYLNNNTIDCLGSVRIKENTLLYIMEGFIFDDKQRYYLLATESYHGVKLKVIVPDMKLMFDRYTKLINND